MLNFEQKLAIKMHKILSSFLILYLLFKAGLSIQAYLSYFSNILNNFWIFPVRPYYFSPFIGFQTGKKKDTSNFQKAKSIKQKEYNLNYKSQMQVTSRSQFTKQATSINVIPPEQILQGLLAQDVGNCNCSTQQQKSSRYDEPANIENVQSAIFSLQQTIDAMNHQVVEVQNLLSQRDMLYHQLDHLRAEREQIQDEIQNQQITIHKSIKVKSSRGLKEMNERLRRRIRQVKQYIDKMDNQNLKIQESMSINQSMYIPQMPQPIPKYNKIHTYTEYRGPSSPNWMERINPTYQSSNYKLNRDYFDGLRKKLHQKQEQAWDRVRRQQQEIQNRNARSLMNFNKVGMRSNYLSPRYRAY